MSLKVNMDSTLGGVKLIMDGYKNLCRQYKRHGTTKVHSIAFSSMRKTIKYELNDMLNRNLFFKKKDTRETFNITDFKPKASEQFKKRVMDNSFFHTSKDLTKEIKVHEEVILKTETYELLTDMKMLAHAFEHKLEQSMIYRIIKEKNIRRNIFSEAINNEDLINRVKTHLDIAKENSHYVPQNLQNHFFYYLEYLECQFTALSHPFFEVKYPRTLRKIIPYKLSNKSRRLTKTKAERKTPLDLHKTAIIRLQHIIDRLQHGPSVRFSSLQSPMTNISYCVPATYKNKPEDEIFSIYYERMRYQAHLWDSNYKGSIFASLPEVKNAFLPEIGEKVPNNGDYKSIFINEDQGIKETGGVEIFKQMKKDGEEEKAKFEGLLSTEEMTLLYLDAFKQDYKNLLKMKKKYDKLQLDDVYPYVKKKELLYQLIQNDLVDDIKTYRNVGFVIYRFLKHIKSLHISYYHDHIK